jgi:signal transduction histidine kinase/ActR/RegA family two-component response regulator
MIRSTLAREVSAMDASKSAVGAAVTLESVLRTEELKRRPSRPPDYLAENRALLALAHELTNAPASVLQKLVDIALELCRGHSAGISLLEEGPPGHLTPTGDHFRWHAVAGQWASLIWNTTTPRDFGPCGTVLDRNSTLLFSNAHRYYTQFAGVLPLLVEGLLVPFYIDGQAVGTVWVIAHDETRQFDGEDQRLLESLATFAATAYQVRSLLSAQARANQELQAEVAERQRTAAALREADRRKNEFLALLAHELRNPLTPISNALQVLRLSKGIDESVRSTFEMMQRQLGQIVLFVNDLLDVSRISRGAVRLRKGRTELASPVHHAVEAAGPLCQRMGHQLTVEVAPEPIFVDADPARLAQVVGNLLTNACKFTDRGGRIRLTVAREGEHAVIRVRDTGIGIAADQLPHIFDMFMQVDRSLERSASGLGVGLTLVKSLVESHGGTVEVRSAGIGQGSEFIVRLPVLSEADEPSPKPAIVEPSPTMSRRILVVDDNRDSAESLAMLLKLTGNETRTAYDGLEAVEAAARFRPDVVLMDVGLPNLNGYDAARRIREQPWGKGMVLVALTGWGQDEDRQKSKEAGFNDHLVKPLDHAALMQLLAETAASVTGA